MKTYVSVIFALHLVSMDLFGWTNGELLVWMDSDRGYALAPTARRFEADFGIKVTIESPEKITDSFAIAAQAGKGPDIVIWAHDKLGEWAAGGLIAPLELSEEFLNKFSPKAWQALLHEDWMWGYPISLETGTLIYNKKLLEGSPPTTLSDLVSLNEQIRKKHPEATAILWDYKSSYYSWGILASAGGYVFGKNGRDYDLQNVGVASRGAIEGLSEIIALIHAGVLPKSVSYSAVEDLMGRGKLAMMISGPWAWLNLMKSGIDFGVAPIPGVAGNPGRPFVGVSVAYLNRSSPNQDLAKEFLERYVLTGEGLGAMDHRKPIGLPALISLQEKMVKNSALLKQLRVCVDYGEVMPNVPQMGRFFSSLGAALKIATDGQASTEAALLEAKANMRHE
ncbi:MAG TPA: maltose/maltodextrin ABC transporter substrate-binding protein MalE [Chthoniobacterales bacterium]|nr:maltose/maltodextrin ABC transporter substrate-binding protein MalE [Chthoniobacterales bacterium]